MKQRCLNIDQLPVRCLSICELDEYVLGGGPQSIAEMSSVSLSSIRIDLLLPVPTPPSCSTKFACSVAVPEKVLTQKTEQRSLCVEQQPTVVTSNIGTASAKEPNPVGSADQTRAHERLDQWPDELNYTYLSRDSCHH